MRRDRIAPVAVVVVAGGLLFQAGCEDAPTAPTMPRAVPTESINPARQVELGPTPMDLKNHPLPDFNLGDIEGGRVTKAGLAGKVVLIDFWATWCVPCQRLSPVLDGFQKKYGPRGLVVLGANTREKDKYGISVRTPGAAEYYRKDHNLSFRFAYGAEDFETACNVEALPTLLLVDRKGVVRDVWVGLKDGIDEAMRQAIEKVLAE